MRTQEWLARFIDRLTRGEVPVDGFEVRKLKPMRQPKPPPKTQPVRWGNFR